MPEFLKALIVILVLSVTIFKYGKVHACTLASKEADFERRRNLWIAVTTTAFVAHSFWIYISLSAAFLIFSAPRESNKLALFFSLLFAVPVFESQITGLGIINQLFSINSVRLLALTVLLPAFFQLRKQPDTERFGRLLPDKLLISYIILNCLQTYEVSTLTNTLRSGIFYPFIDIVLPYYVASRSMRNLIVFRDAMVAYVFAALILSAISIFEFPKGWLLYGSLKDTLGIDWGYGNYLMRSTNLRALASTGHPIALGLALAVAIGFLLFLKKSIASSVAWRLALALLLMGMIATVSRGPWVGAAAILVVFFGVGPSAGTQFIKFGLIGAVCIVLLMATPAFETIISYLPFVGTVEESTVLYRQHLFDVSIEIIMQNPIFGNPYFFLTEEMQSLKEGGIIDIVNSYIFIALSQGLLGLSLFSGFFVFVVFSVFTAMRRMPDKNDEKYLLGQALFATLIGILIIIATVSSITVIPVIYWSVAGLGVAYVRLLKKEDVTMPLNENPLSYRPEPIKAAK